MTGADDDVAVGALSGAREFDRAALYAFVGRVSFPFGHDDIGAEIALASWFRVTLTLPADRDQTTIFRSAEPGLNSIKVGDLMIEGASKKQKAPVSM